MEGGGKHPLPSATTRQKSPVLIGLKDNFIRAHVPNDHRCAASTLEADEQSCQSSLTAFTLSGHLAVKFPARSGCN